MIRGISENDIEKVLEIASSSEYITLTRNNITTYLYEGVYRCFCFCDENTMLGFIIATMIEDEAEIIDIAVSKKQRRKGVGGSLLSYFMEYAKLSNVKRIILDVNENNKEAFSFYEKNGFKKYGVRKKYYTKPFVSDAFLMDLVL